jgi:Ferritin-like domain
VRRRELLLAAAAAGLALPASARAAKPPTEGAVLTDLTKRELAAIAAYNRALAVLGSDAPPELAAIRANDNAHAHALTTELAAVGLPRPRSHPDALLALFEATHSRLAATSMAAGIEAELVTAYQRAIPLLPDAKVATTIATILASHAQHALILTGRPLADG